jgi:deoxyribodipyrimidine photo-lyase
VAGEDLTQQIRSAAIAVAPNIPRSVIMTKSANPPVILWFRNDLRLSDHAALHAAVGTGQPVLPVFILDDQSPGPWALGGASRWWLHHSLTSLQAGLKQSADPAPR